MKNAWMLGNWGAVAVALITASADRAFAQPVVADSTLTLTASVVFTGAQAARFDPFNPARIWVGRRGTSADGLYRISRAGRAERLAAGSNVAGVVVDPQTRMVFFAEDFGGSIFRVDTTTVPVARSTWVSGLHAGDDDPTGLRIAPPRYTGTLVRPGGAVLIDRGSAGPDEIWAWSSSVAQAQRVLVTDAANPAVDGVDIAFGTTELYVADTGEGAPGRFWRVSQTGTVSALFTQAPPGDPVALELDPLTGELVYLDAGAGRLASLDLTSGAIRDLVTGLSVPADAWSSVDLRADGSEVLVTAGDTIFTFSRCATGLTAANDCNNNGTMDACELAQRAVPDCNANGVPDACDLRLGTSIDCDGDQIPDECPQCPPVEVVVFFDTSASMNDEAASLCGEVTGILSELEARGLSASAEVLGISDTPGGAYACLQDHVMRRYGTAVPGTPPPGNQVLGACPGGNEVASEDWGRATSVVAGVKTWGSGTVRVVAPIADEGPWCGDPVNQSDADSIIHAIRTATAAGVRVSPITGTGASAAVVSLAKQLAAGTGGIQHATTAADVDIPEAVLSVVQNACFSAVDCNENRTIDACDIARGASSDCDHNEVPDECQDPRPAPCGPVDGGVVADASEPAPDGAILDVAIEVDAAPADAALPVDAGGPTADAGFPADSGVVPGQDAAQAPSLDAAARDTGGEAVDEGCTCRTNAGGARPSGLGWAMGIALFLALHRRRR